VAEDKIWWTEAQIALVEQARDAVQLALRRVQDSEGRNTAVEDRIEAIEQAIIARQAAIEAVIGANVPEHEWDGTLFRLRNPDGSWGAWVDLLSPLATIRNAVLAARDTVVSVGAQVTVDAAAAVTAAGQTAADRAIVTADKTTVAADKATVAADKATVAADKALVAADKATVAADKATVATDKNAAAASAAAAAASALALDPILKSGLTPTIDLDLSAPEGLLYNSFARGGTLGAFEDARGLIATSYGLRIAHRDGVARGALVEEASSNALTQSETITAAQGWSAAVAVFDAAKINPRGDLGAYYPALGETVMTFNGASATSVALSFFAAKRTGSENFIRLQPWQEINGGNIFDVGSFDFNFDAANPDQTYLKNVVRTALPNGWYHFSAQLLARPVGSGFFHSTARLDIEGVGGNQPYVWGLQVEPAKLSASSYMRSNGSAASRATDVLLINGTDFSQQVRPEAGTVFVRGMFGPIVNSNQALAYFSDGSANNRVVLFRQSSDRTLVARVDVGGVAVMSINLGVASDFAVCNVALRWKDGDLAGSLNGGAAVTATGGNPSRAMNQLRLGATQSGLNVLSGTIRRFAYSPGLATNSKLQEMSAL